MTSGGAPFITKDQALIFRIAHIDNLAWILANGLHCSTSPTTDPHFIDIGNTGLIAKRKPQSVPIPPRGTLKDYIPFYFTPFSPMLLNIKTGRGVTQRSLDEIVILWSSLPALEERGIPFVFTDRHAFLQTAQFSNSLVDLDRIDWPLLQARDFARDPNDPGKMERYQAEALVHQHLPCDTLEGIICYSKGRRAEVEALVADAGLDLKVTANAAMYV